MITPAFAIVRPRVVGNDGEPRPLEDVLDSTLSHGGINFLILQGPPGSGKSTALRHTAAVLSIHPQWSGQCRFVDDDEFLSLEGRTSDPTSQFTIAAASNCSIQSGARLNLAGWDRDDIIEYLLARHPDACASVMARINDGATCAGLPLLWTIALDCLASHPTLPDIRSALATHLKELKLPVDCKNALGRLAWMAMIGVKDSDHIVTSMLDRFMLSEMEHFFVTESVQCLMACQYYVDQVRSSRGQIILQHRVPDDLLPFVADELRHDDFVIDQLQKILTRKVDRTLHSASMTLLVAIDPSWRPREVMREVNLNEATLNRVRWPGIDLRGADLDNASLIDADLSEAKLGGAALRSASLIRTNLQRASLIGANLSFSDFSGSQFQMTDLTSVTFEGAEADGSNFENAELQDALLIDATLRRASFRDANLVRTSFIGTTLDHCDFTGTNLSSTNFDRVDLTTCCFDAARLDRAYLIDCLMDEVAWRNVSLLHASLQRASLSGSQLHSADLRWANLTLARLGDIDWPNADLRFANLSGASFHQGSSRGGLVFSPYACEGSKTGFYTDDFFEQHFKAPEEIRKANLRGADLRGAVLTGVDFYLVDLRDAILDATQLEYVKSCGAILSSSVVDE